MKIVCSSLWADCRIKWIDWPGLLPFSLGYLDAERLREGVAFDNIVVLTIDVVSVGKDID